MTVPVDPATQPLLDDGTLSELAGGAGDEIIGPLVEGFLEESEERVQAIRDAVARSDIDAIGFQAHALKSTASTYGAMRLGSIAALLESVARQGDCDAATVRVRDIDQTWPATRVAFVSRFLSG